MLDPLQTFDQYLWNKQFGVSTSGCCIHSNWPLLLMMLLSWTGWFGNRVVIKCCCPHALCVCVCQVKSVHVCVHVPALGASVQSKIQCSYFLADLCGDVCLCAHNHILERRMSQCSLCVCAHVHVCLCLSITMQLCCSKITCREQQPFTHSSLPFLLTHTKYMDPLI